jgi:hypothetical protein
LVASKVLTVRIYEPQIEFLKKLRERTGFNESECVRFCIDLANLLLSYSPFGDKLYRMLEEAVRRSLERQAGRTKP